MLLFAIIVRNQKNCILLSYLYRGWSVLKLIELKLNLCWSIASGTYFGEIYAFENVCKYIIQFVRASMC